MLAMHQRRDALFVVRAGVSLAEVAVAVAEDRADAVSGWIERGQLTRPTPSEIAAWALEEGAQFVSVILQPYVFAQRLDDLVKAATDAT